jgi:hypothetical protein
MAIAFTPSAVIRNSTGNTHYFDENQQNETILGTFSGLNLPAGSYTISSASHFAAFYKLVVIDPAWENLNYAA